MLPPFNPLNPKFRADPYPFYARYRAEDPVHWAGAPDHKGPGAWYLFRHRDAMAALKDARLGRQNRSFLPPEPIRDMFAQWMLFRNPPDHTRLRALVSKAFTNQVAERLAPSIQEVADFLVDQVQPSRAMDIILHYASPLPVIVIAEMLGIPPEDRDQFRKWSIDVVMAVDFCFTKDEIAIASKAALELYEYLRGVVAARRRQPREDLISTLIAAEEQGDKLNEEELVSMCMLLLGAGHETSVNLIGNGMLALLRHPEEMARLCTEPELMETAVEELLRFDCPVQMTFREAYEDLEIAGHAVRRGEQIGILLGAANRDPEQFPDPDVLNLARTPNRHSSFGMGIHFCLGAPLARLEARIAFATLLRRLPTTQISAPALEWRKGILFHGLKSLPIGW